MSSFHGMWSVGAFVGVGLGALAVAVGVSLAAQLAVLGVVGLVVAGSATRAMLSDPPHEDATGPRPSAADGVAQPRGAPRGRRGPRRDALRGGRRRLVGGLPARVAGRPA